MILYYSIRDSKFPPFETSCPTYYTLDTSGNSCKINSIYDSGNANNSPFDTQNPVAANLSSNCTNVPLSQFYQNNYSDSDTLCAKKKWANNCSIFWDGVTNNSNACIKHSDNLFV